MSEQRTFWGVELSSSKKVNILVLISVIGLLGLIIVAPYLYDKKSAIYVPMYIDSSKEHGVLFNIDHSLCLTDADGTLIDSRRYEDLGIKEVADAKFFNDSIILVQGDGKIKKCSTSLNSCTSIGSVSSYRADIFMRIIPAKDEKSFYVIQTNKSKIDKFDTTGKHLYRLNLKEEEMKYPGGGVALTNDIILVANTKYKSIAVIQDRGEDNISILGSLSTYSDMERHSFRKVLDVKLDASSNIWMTNTNKGYKEADVLMMDIPSLKDYKSHINLPERIEVEDGHTQRIESRLIKYPTSLTPHKEGMLVSDSETYKILYTDDSSVPAEFGDSYVQNRFRKLAEKRAYYQNIIDGLIWLFGIGMFLAVVAAIMEAPRAAKKMVMEESRNIDYVEKESIPESKRIEPDENGIVWLPPSEKLIKQLKWFKLLIAVAMLFSIYLVVQLFTALQTTEFSIILLETITAISMPLTLMILFHSLNFSNHSIGVSETHLHIRVGANKKTAATFENVAYLARLDFFEDNSSPVRIAINNITIPLFHSNEMMFNNRLFDQEQFNYYIMPKLKFAQRISGGQMFRRQVKNINFQIWISIPLIIIMMAIFLKIRAYF